MSRSTVNQRFWAVGWLKCVLLNADMKGDSIVMSTVEPTEAEVTFRIDAEVRQVIESLSGALP